MKRLLTALINLFFPPICAACGGLLNWHEQCICLKCLYFLPRTNFHLQKDNKMERRFWGKIPIERATAFFYFNKKTPYQKILHQLKYKERKEIGLELGEFFGAELMNSPDFATVDVIVPVPLHPKKLKKRGYNQSEWIAQGIAKQLQKPLDTDTLFRRIENPTQTKMGFFERWENVESIFCIKNTETFRNKHILLVDDVMTTGATITACAKAVLQTKNIKLSIATLAIA